VITNCDINCQQAAGRDYKLFFLVNKTHVLEVRRYLSVSIMVKIYNGRDKFFNTAMVMYPAIEH